MKKLLKCVLALTIIVCILISATAMAASTNVYNLSFSISEVSGANMTGHSASGVLTMQSGDESLVNCVAQYIAANKSKLRPFDSKAMSDLLTKLLDSYDGSNWVSLLDGEMAAANYSSAAFKNVIRNRSSIDSFGVGTGYITFLNSVEGDSREGVTYRISISVSLYSGGDSRKHGNSNIYFTLMQRDNDAILSDVDTSDVGKNDIAIIDLSSEGGITGVIIPKITFSELEEAEVSGLLVMLPESEIYFDDLAIGAIVDQAEGRTVQIIVEIVIEPDISSFELTEEQLSVIPDDTDALAILRIVSNGVEIHDFQGGISKVSFEYEYPEGSVPRAFFMGSDGTVEAVSASADKGIVTLTLKHFSVYIIYFERSLPFTDVRDTSAYYYDAVKWAYENGITYGTSATTFSPLSVITRAEMVTFLWRAAGSPDSESHINPFADVKQGTFYYDAVLWGYEKGIIAGTSATTFSPNMVVTRSQAVTFIARMDGVKDSDVGYTHGFKDVNAGDYFNNAVAWAASNGITYGTSATTFTPLRDCSRAEIVTFLYRYFVEYKA